MLAQLDLGKNRDTSKPGVSRLPKHLDVEVARLNLDRIGVKLTRLTEKQAKVPRRSGRRALQAGALPLLRAQQRDRGRRRARVKREAPAPA